MVVLSLPSFHADLRKQPAVVCKCTDRTVRKLHTEAIGIRCCAIPKFTAVWHHHSRSFRRGEINRTITYQACVGVDTESGCPGQVEEGEWHFDYSQARMVFAVTLYLTISKSISRQ